MNSDSLAGAPAPESPTGQPAAGLMARRPDLLALTDDALAALANRGLVKRAAKDLTKAAPQVEIDTEGTVTADFADGTRTVLGSGGLEAGTCSCSASGVCRHLVGTVLAVRALATGDSDEAAPPWSPADVDDAELLRVLGKPAVDAAHRRIRAGLRATVLVPDPTRTATGDNAAAVDLPTTTVRFLVPGDLGYAHTDVVATERGEQVALAVLAFRAARSKTQASAPPGPSTCEVVLGTPRTATDLRTPFEPTLELVTELVDQGVRMLAGHVGPRIAAARAPLVARGFQWPLDVLDELAEQLEAYAGGHAGYAPAAIAELAAELVARATAGSAHTAEADRILGTRQPARTAMRRARFLGLGARVSRADDPAGTSASITTRVYLADVDAGVVLVLSTASNHQPDQVPDPGVLARRRVGGLRLGEVARGSLTTESATRTAGLHLRLSAGRAGRSTVTTGASAWDAMPGGLVVECAEDAARELAVRPFRLVAPRFAAPAVRLLRVARVVELGYRPGVQLLTAQLEDATGAPIELSCPYRAAAPGALDAVASALTEAAEAERGLEISGVLSVVGGRLRIDPLALRTPQGIVVPDLQGAAGTDPGRGSAVAGDALGRVLDAVGDFLAEILHAGLYRMTGSHATRIDRLAGDLEAVGLSDLARALLTLRAPRARAWLDAQLLYLATVAAL